MRRLLILVLFVLLWVGGGDLVQDVGNAADGMPMAGWGLALLGILALGEILADVGLPRITGYLLAGLGLGSLGLNILTSPAQTPVRFLQDAALGVLALQAGFALDLPRLRRVARPTLMISFTNVAVLLVMGGAASFLVAPLVPGLAGAEGALALVLAVMMVCASPVVTVTVMRDAEARGRFTDLALGMTFILDLAALVLMGVAATGAEALMGGSGGVTSGILTPFYALGWSLLVGAVLCAVFLLAGVWTGSSHGLTLLVLVAGAASVVHGPLQAEPVLSFAIAGVLARNIGGEAQRGILARSLQSLELPAALVFFGSLGSQLALPADQGLLIASLVLFAVRLIGLFVGTRLGAAWAGEEGVLRRNLWLSLVPQGGASMGFVAMAAVALPGLGRPLAEVVGAILVLNLFLGPVGLKIALHRSGALKRPEEEEPEQVQEGDEEAVLPEEADADEQEAAPDPLQGLIPPEDPDLEAAWGETTEQLREIRRSVQEQAVTPRLERVGKVLRSSAGQARHSLQVASEACGREETAEGLRAVLRAHRGHLADQVQKGLIDLRPPAAAEDVPLVVHLVSRMADDLVALTPAEITAMETERHLTGTSREPPWTRIGKTMKRALRGIERVFGRPASIRQVPYRRIVRRVVAGELVAELNGMELLVGRAEFRVLRRMETLLRRADQALVDGLVEVDAGRSPEELKAWLQERQLDLREASQQAVEDESLLEQEPVRRLSDAMGRSLEQLTVLSDDAGTFVVGEGRLRFASVAPGARAAAATAGDVRDGWKDKQQALIDRMVLWTRLIKLQQRLRELAFHEALGPARRMHGRLGELLRDAQSRVAAVLGVLQSALGRDDEDAPFDGPGHIRGLVDDLHRRVGRPVEGIAHRLRSGVVVDRLLAAFDNVTGPLPKEMLLLSESAILALHRGMERDEHPMVVNVRRVSRSFFDRHVAVRLAEHMRALEVSADQVVSGVREAIRLLEFELSRDTDEPGSGAEVEAEAGHHFTLEDWVETLQAVVERLGQEIAQTGETAAALHGEISETESSAVEALWEQLQEATEPSQDEEDSSGLWTWVEDTWTGWMQSPLIQAVRNRGSRLVAVIAELRGEEDMAERESVHGPTRIRQELQRFLPQAEVLPYVYGKLFSLQATENEAFIVERDQEAEFVRQRLHQGHGGGLVVVGDRGCGRTSLLRVVLANPSSSRETLWLDADRPFDTRLQLLKWIGRSAGMKGQHIDVLTVATYLRKRDKLLVIDGLEHLMDRSAGGLDALDALAELMTATRRSVTWLATAERGVWSLLQEISPVADLFDEVVYLKPLSADGIELAVQRRHALSGLNLKFVSAGGWSLGGLMDKLTRTPPERMFFRWIQEESQGNPRAALHLWTLSLERATERALRVVHGHPLRLDMLSTLPLRLAPVLLVCLQHGMLDVPHLHRAMGWSLLEAQTALNSLSAMGLIDQRPRSDGDVTWVVPPTVEHVVHRYLSQRGLLGADRRPS